MENLGLKETLEELQRYSDPGGEREQLLSDVAGLRSKVLELLENNSYNSDVEAVAARAAAASAARIEEAAAHAQAEALKLEQLEKVWMA